MNAHKVFEELLPLYAAGQLQGAQRAEVERHLAACPACQADLELWQVVAGEIRAEDHALVAPPVLVDRVLEQVHQPGQLQRAALHAWQLLRTQAMLVQSELWPAAAVVMAMGVAVALIADKAAVLYFLTPLVAASTLAVLYGPEHDPAVELTLATPTSPWKLLLARLTVVSAYNLALALVAGLVLLSIVPAEVLGTMLLGWLGPLAFLSALALLLSIWIGTNNAIAIVYSLWMLQYIPFKMVILWIDSPAWVSAITTYQQFWHSPLLLLPLSLLLIGLALWSADRPALRLAPTAG